MKILVIANIIFLDAVVSYSDKLKNRTGNEMTGNHGKYSNNNLFYFLDSEKFHEMASAAETPPKTCFLLDDDGEFPPVAFAAS